MQAYPQGQFTDLHVFVFEILSPSLHIEHTTRIFKSKLFWSPGELQP